MLEKIKEQLRGDESLIEAIRSKTASLQIETSGKAAEEITKADLQSIFEEAYKEVVKANSFVPEKDL